MNINKHLILYFLCWCSFHLAAQDPFFVHFNNNKPLFNPAMVGHRGAFSIDMKYKTQWANAGAIPFRTAFINIEESVPCEIFEYGLSYRYDEEGDGRFQTHEGAFRFAGVRALEIGNVLQNFRIGGAFQFAKKRIDYSQLIFSDQLDPKYGRFDRSGNLLQSSFIPPNDGKSPLIFTPAVGVAYRALFTKRKKKSVLLLLGASVHNAYSLGDFLGNEESVLGMETLLPRRFNAFLESEFVIYDRPREYVSLTPSIFYQQQGSLSYYEAGIKLNWSRVISGGIYYHFNTPPEQGQNSNWFSFNLDLGSVMVEDAYRMDFGASFATGLTGVRNSVGPILEFTASIHLAKSFTCQLTGGMDQVNYGKHPQCVVSRKRKKIYENIWYKRSGNQ